MNIGSRKVDVRGLKSTAVKIFPVEGCARAREEIRGDLRVLIGLHEAVMAGVRLTHQFFATPSHILEAIIEASIRCAISISNRIESCRLTKLRRMSAKAELIYRGRDSMNLRLRASIIFIFTTCFVFALTGT